MRKGTKIALAASALVLAGAAGLSSMAVAEYRGSHGGKHHNASYSGHEGHGWGHHRGGQRRGGHHKGWGKGHRMDRMMERFDVNSDGKLTQEEVDEARKALLTKFDENKDGKLSLAEFEKLWLDFMHRRMVRGFQRIDRDGDAAITMDEYLKPFSKVVERLDRNDDGVFDKEDRRKQGRRHHMNDDDSPRSKKRDG